MDVLAALFEPNGELKVKGDPVLVAGFIPKLEPNKFEVLLFGVSNPVLGCPNKLLVWFWVDGEPNKLVEGWVFVDPKRELVG